MTRSSREPPAQLARPLARGRQHHVLRPAPGAGRAPPRRAPRRRRSAKRSRSRRSAVSTSTRAPVSGSTIARRPTAGSARSRGSRTSTAISGVPRAQRRQRARPVGRPGEVRHDDDQAARTRQAPRSHERAARAARRRVPSGATPSASARRTPMRAPRPPRGGSSRATGPPKVSRPTRPPRRTASVREHVDDALGHVALEPVGGAERHRRRHVQHDPGRQQPLGHLLAHVGDAGARRGGRVDLAHVVAGLVGAQLRELGARAHPGAPVLARAHPAHTPYESEVERLHQGAGHRPGPLTPGRWAHRCGAHAASGSEPAERRSGSGTASRIRSSRSSGRAPSLSPS